MVPEAAGQSGDLAQPPCRSPAALLRILAAHDRLAQQASAGVADRLGRQATRRPAYEGKAGPDNVRAADEGGIALALEPQHAGAHKGLGFVNFKRGDMDGALEHLELALAADPADDSVVQALRTVRSAAIRADPGDAAPASPHAAPAPAVTPAVRCQLSGSLPSPLAWHSRQNPGSAGRMKSVSSPGAGGGCGQFGPPRSTHATLSPPQTGQQVTSRLSQPGSKRSPGGSSRSRRAGV